MGREDLSEELLFDEDEELGPAGGQESEDGTDGPASPAGQPVEAAAVEGAVDIAGTSCKSASIQSSTLRASLDDMGEGGGGGGGPAAMQGLHDRAPPLPLRGGPGFFPIAASLPARTSAVQMGSSVPIAIPPMARWKAPEQQQAPGAGGNGGGGNGGGGGGGLTVAVAVAAGGVAQQPEAAGGGGGGGGFSGAPFVPPHKLTQADEFSFSFTGASPSATLKRERLRTRNAVLMRTGFLEQRGEAGGGGGPGGGGLGGGGAPAVAHSLPAGGALMARLAAAEPLLGAQLGRGGAGAGSGTGLAPQPQQQARPGGGGGSGSGSGSGGQLSSLTAALTTIGEAA